MHSSLDLCVCLLLNALVCTASCRSTETQIADLPCMLQFALSRQQPKTPQTPGHAPNATLPESSSSIPPTADSVQNSHATSGLPPSMPLPNAASGSASAPASAAAPPSVTVTHHKPDAVAAVDQNAMGLDVSPADRRRIDEENRQLVKDMSPAEVEEARLELMSRLSPSAQAFLAKRAAAKQRNAAMPQAASIRDQPAIAGGISATTRAHPTTAAKQASTAAQEPQPASNGAAGNASKAGSAVKPSTAGKAGTVGTAGTAGTAGIASNTSKAGTKQTSIADKRHAPSAERDTGANSNSIASADVDIVSRLRFSLEGQVVGLKAVADAARGPGDGQQVVQRDILRWLPVKHSYCNKQATWILLHTDDICTKTYGVMLVKFMRCCMVLASTCIGGTWFMGNAQILCVCCVTSYLLLSCCDLYQAVRGQFTTGLYPAGGLHACSQQRDQAERVGLTHPSSCAGSCKAPG